jgi:arylsulfatase A-like enzyme
MQPGISTVDESHSLTNWTVRQSIDFLETRDPTRPFCLYTSFSKPHPPLDPCLSYWMLYQNAQVPSPLHGDWSQNVEMIDDGWLQPTWIGSAADALSKEQIIQCRRAYYALITQIDYNLGLLFARLRELNLLDSTLILFTADHGDMLGDHHFGAKTVPLEGAAHIPMLMMPPTGVLEEKRGTVENSLVCLADVLPTFCGVAGIEKQDLPDTDGMDLCGVIEGQNQREQLMIRYNGYHTILKDNFKYAFCEKGGSELMFDLARDPYEQHELIRAGTHREIHRELRGILAAQMQAQNHPACKDGELVSTEEPRPRRRVRAYPWPGFHHPLHTPLDLIH